MGQSQVWSISRHLTAWNRWFPGLCLLSAGLLPQLSQAQDYVLPKCEILPLPDHQTSLRVDGVERVRWHFDRGYPRPFFYPFNGPAGAPLTRMGHPGAENHDHHRSIWLAHQNVNGVDFWADGGGSIRQKHWYAYRDGTQECIMAVRLGWYDGNGVELLDQDLVAAMRPLPGGESVLELQLVLRVPEGGDAVTLGKTSLGPLAVRVAKSLSEYFGGGQLRSSEGLVGEAAIFGTRARWVDYSGPVAVGQDADRQLVRQGITFFDHPQNLRYPTHWHVRADGWMGAALGMQATTTIRPSQPLTLRYLLHAHSATWTPEAAEDVHREFSLRPGFRVVRAGPDRPHRQYEVERLAEEE